MIDLESYGGRRGYLASLRARSLYALGSYRSARTINWAAVTRLVFVCHGNICRSPYANMRAHALGAHATSLGIAAVEGASANEDAARNALPRGIDLTNHRSMRLNSSLLAQGDLIVVFEPRQFRVVVRQHIEGLAGVTLLGLWSQPVRPHIQDPYGRSDGYFQHCFDTIDRNVRELVKRLPAPEANAAIHGAPGRLSVRDAQ